MNSILERQMSRGRAVPPAIDYDAYRARAFAERQQARRDVVRSVARHFKRAGLVSIQTAVAAAILAGAILLAFGSAEAKPNTTQSCEKKHHDCGVRCQRKYADVSDPIEWSKKVSACLSRTCDPQKKACMANVTPGKLENPPPAHKPRPEQASGSHISDPKPVPNPLTSTTNNSAPFGAGILGGGSGMGGNGPSATGSSAGGGMPPSAPPAAPPVILR